MNLLKIGLDQDFQEKFSVSVHDISISGKGIETVLYMYFLSEVYNLNLVASVHITFATYIRIKYQVLTHQILQLVRANSSNCVHIILQMLSVKIRKEFFIGIVTAMTFPFFSLANKAQIIMNTV